MKKEQFEHIENTLRELALYIRNARIEEEKENFRKLFYVVKDNVAPLRNKTVDLKLNILNARLWTEKEQKEMPYLKDLKYRKTQNGIHQFRYRRDGYNVSFNSKNFETAKKKARDFIKKLKKQQNDKIQVKHADSLADVSNQWLELKKPRIVQSTYRVYLGVLKNHVLPIFGNRAIKNILPKDLQPFFNNLCEKQSKTAEDSKQILNQIFDYAVANRLCLTNPMQGVIVDKHIRVRGKALNNEQIHRFVSIMEDKGSLGLAYLIILNSGIRGAELEKMTFNWEDGTCTVFNAKLKRTQKMYEDNIKRTFPIMPTLYKYRERIENEKWNYKSATLSSKLYLYWTENTVKDLRHTFISKARESGVENELVNLWTGHLPGRNVTANIYTHFSMEYQMKESKKIVLY